MLLLRHPNKTIHPSSLHLVLALPYLGKAIASVCRSLRLSILAHRRRSSFCEPKYARTYVRGASPSLDSKPSITHPSPSQLQRASRPIKHLHTETITNPERARSCPRLGIILLLSCAHALSPFQHVGHQHHVKTGFLLFTGSSRSTITFLRFPSIPSAAAYPRSPSSSSPSSSSNVTPPCPW